MPNLTPSQEAREAAASLYAELHDVWEGYSACVAMREGYAGNHPFVQAFARFEQAIRKDEAEQCARDKARLDYLIEESSDLRCFDIPTGAGDADIGWQVVAHFQAEPRERVVAQVWHDDPRAAIDEAIAAALRARHDGGPDAR